MTVPHINNETNGLNELFANTTPTLYAEWHFSFKQARNFENREMAF